MRPSQLIDREVKGSRGLSTLFEMAKAQSDLVKQQAGIVASGLLLQANKTTDETQYCEDLFIPFRAVSQFHGRQHAFKPPVAYLRACAAVFLKCSIMLLI